MAEDARKSRSALIGIACVVNALFLFLGVAFGFHLTTTDYPSNVRLAGLFWAAIFVGAAIANLCALRLRPVRWRHWSAWVFNGVLILCGFVPKLTAFDFRSNEQVVVVVVAIVSFIAVEEKRTKNKFQKVIKRAGTNPPQHVDGDKEDE